MKKHYLEHKEKTKKYAKVLRDNQTMAERVFWFELLSKDKTGYRFTRQKPILNYIIDFYCAKLKLAIEIDGYSHEETEKYDQIRTRLLSNLGIKVIRYNNFRILNKLNKVSDDLNEQIVIREKELNLKTIPNNPPLQKEAGSASWRTEDSNDGGIKSLGSTTFACPLSKRGISKSGTNASLSPFPTSPKVSLGAGIKGNFLKIYVFGNEDYVPDSMALVVMKKMQERKLKVEFVVVKPNQDLPFVGEKKVILMDNIAGIEKVMLIEDKDLDKLVMSPRNSVHDFDLGFQIKYLKKLGKLGEVRIIGLPMEGKIQIDKIRKIIDNL